MSRALRQAIERIEEKVEGLASKGTIMELPDIVFIDAACDKDGNLVFDDDGRLQTMEWGRMTHNDDGTNDREDYLSEELQEKVEAAKKKLFDRYVHGGDYVPPKHGPAIGEITGIWGDMCRYRKEKK